MAIKNLKRHLTKIVTLLSAIAIIFSNTIMVKAAPILIDGNGTVKVNDTAKTGGTVDIATEAKALFDALRLYLGGSLGIALITLTLAFVIKCGQLAASADNANKRSNHITGMVYLIIAIASIGGFKIVMDILVGMAFNWF